LTVNQLVVGSIPTAGAKDFKGLAEFQLTPFLLWGTLGAHPKTSTKKKKPPPFQAGVNQSDGTDRRNEKPATALHQYTSRSAGPQKPL
jgi:hypothetical protein